MKSLKLTLLFWGLLALMNVSAQKKVRAFSLSEATQLAVDSNLTVLCSKLEVEKSQQQLREAKSAMYPKISAYSNYKYYYAIPQTLFPGEFFGTTGDIAVEIGTKYDWSNGFTSSLALVNVSNLTAIRIARQMQEISNLDLSQQKEEMAYQVRQVYYLCQATQNQVDLLRQNMENTNRLLIITQNQMSNGTARKSDYTKVQVAKNNLQSNIDNLMRVLQQQLDLLKYLMGVDVNTDITLTTAFDDTQDAVALKLPDFASRTDIVLADKKIEVAALNRKAIQNQYIPNIDLQGELYYQGQQNSFNYLNGGDKFFKVGFIGVNLSIPIFDGFEKGAKIRQFKIEQQQLSLTKENTLRGMQKDYLDAIKQYNNSSEVVARQKENILLAEADYNSSLSQYNEQVLSLSDLMLSDNALTEARLSYVDALLQLKNAQLELMKMNGELLNF